MPKMSHFKNVETKKWFLGNFWEKLFWEIISCTIKFHGKNFPNSFNPGEFCLMKCLNCLNFVTAHAFLTGWYLFTFFTVGPFLCTPSVIRDFCFILVGAHKSKLKVEDFIFHVAVFSRETFQTLAWKFLLCVLQNVFGVYIFPNFVLV